MIKRRIGNSRSLTAIGLGCMGISFTYGPAMEDVDAVSLLHQAVDRGVDHFDTVEMYGLGHSEQMFGKAFNDRRDKGFIATKFGPMFNRETRRRSGVDGSAANAKSTLEQSLRYLQTDHADLWCLHRRDFSRPIEETVSAMADAVKEGSSAALACLR
jgi:hypothetical protein